MNLLYKSLVLFFVSYIYSLNGLNAQIPGMRKYTQIDGFSATIGYAIMQDEKGYLWIGTDNGGMYFDGKTFRMVQDRQSTPDMDILSCYALSHDKILLIPLTQRISYFQNGRLITAAQDSQLRTINHAMHNVAAVDLMNNNYWIWGKGIPEEVFKISKDAITRYAVIPSGFDVINVINDRLIGTRTEENGLLRPSAFDPVKQYYTDFTNEQGKRISWQESLLRGNNGHYLISRDLNTRKTINIYQYPDKGNVLRRVQKITTDIDNRFLKPLIDRHNNLWLSGIGKEGFWYYGNVTKTGNKPFYFPQPENINSMFIDDQSNLWLTTPNNALYFISKKHLNNAMLNDRFPLKKEIPKMISGDGNGALFISYVNSYKVAYIRGKTTAIKTMAHLFPEGSRIILPVKNKGFLLMDKGIAFYHVGTNSISYIIEDETTNKDACFYKDDGLLIATNTDVRYIASFLQKNPAKKIIFPRRATAVEAFINGSMLIGTANGIYQKQSLQDQAQLIPHPLLKESNITDIQRLNSSSALIGTNSYGIFLYTLSGTVKHLAKEQIRSVKYIYRQNDSTYWIATNTGAFRLTFDSEWETKAIKQYTFYDGLPSNSINSIYVDADTAYIATSEGLGILPLQHDRAAILPPPRIYLNTFLAGQDTLNASDSLFTLQPEQKNILISLSAIAYESMGNVTYHYRMYPLQKQWIATKDPDIRFSGLPPGQYRFQFYASNAMGNKSAKTIDVEITVQPTFWQTAYFRWGLPFVLSLCFFPLFRKIIIRRQEKKMSQIEQKKQLASLELEAIKAQINPHFIHNCLNSIQYLNYQAEYHVAQEYLGLFARLIRMTMNYSRQTFITISEELDYLSNYLQLEKLRFKERLTYTFDMATSINRELLMPAMMIQPYVENALKHSSPHGPLVAILIHFEEDEEHIHIRIRDNGPGFPQTKQSDHLGLRLSGSRASSYNELFGLNILVHCYNVQEQEPENHGAIVYIKIPKIKIWSP